MDFNLGPIRLSIHRNRHPATTPIAPQITPQPAAPEPPPPAPPEPHPTPESEYPPPGLLHYQCNVSCGASETRVMFLNRKAASYKRCGSNVRMRSWR
ncbi:MAG: hypothetical protein ACFCBU_00380 [Cyanophyceae cyanobacterium]